MWCHATANKGLSGLSGRMEPRLTTIAVHPSALFASIAWYYSAAVFFNGEEGV
jgi:hypothetical protein